MVRMERIPKKAILCVDDEKIILQSLKAQIKKHFGDRCFPQIITVMLTGQAHEDVIERTKKSESASVFT